jgi:hypothetical protein
MNMGTIIPERTRFCRYYSANWDLDEVAALKDRIIEEDALVSRMANV